MPRKPSKSHPLRTVRARLGLSQAQFGKQFDVSGYTIFEIENGRLTFPVALAAKIALCYGLDKGQLVSGLDPEHPRLQHSTIEFQKEHYDRLSRVNADEIDERLAMLCFVMCLMCDAAGKKLRFRNAAAELAEALKAKARQLGLEDEMLALLGRYGAYKGYPEATRAVYDMLFGSGLVKVDTFIANRAKVRAREREELKPEPGELQSSATDTAPNKP